MSPKTGRPTEDPRTHKISVRLNEKSMRIVNEYCKQEEISKTAAIERAIETLEVEIKK